MNQEFLRRLGIPVDSDRFMHYSMLIYWCGSSQPHLQFALIHSLLTCKSNGMFEVNTMTHETGVKCTDYL